MSDERSRMLRHAAPPKQDELVAGSAENIEAISDHIERHVGPVHMVFHEIASTTVHVDIHHVAATPTRPFHHLVTSGMSDRAMTVPAGEEASRFAELLVALPADWPLTRKAFEDEGNYWPIRTLKTLARLPHEHETWLGPGHTVGNGEPPQPYAPGTDLCGSLLLVPMTVPAEFGTLSLPTGAEIQFLQVFPVYAEEMQLKIERGTDALLELLERNRVPLEIDPRRRSVCRPRARWWDRWRRLSGRRD